ncbi:hypothetical protein TIFTF001_009597 [Ficus carica]|uniref:Uncharacterized protein n=1 Tax=Ficus carica TaxID=3494 RepID=A0AA87ZQ77_FICCA|nr:hypothetical protein TIFTF001_009597 [Ficus carica]
MDCIGGKALYRCSSNRNKQLSILKFIDNKELTLLTIDRHGWRIRHSTLFIMESATSLQAIVLVNGWHILLKSHGLDGKRGWLWRRRKKGREGRVALRATGEIGRGEGGGGRMREKGRH